MITTSAHPQALDLLKQYFGYSHFRGQQAEIIQQALEGNDCMVLMPTGGGKSMCYQIPALLKEGITLVVSPLISLMKDQVDTLRSNGIEAAFMNSSLSQEQENEIAARCFHGKLKLLYMAPEKVISSLDSLISKLPLSFIAIDEAHCVSQWGHDFRPEYKELYKLRQVLPNIPIMALTATADKITRVDIVNLLGLHNPQQFVSSFDRPNLSLAVKPGLNKKEKIKDISTFIQQDTNPCGIIYCTSRATTESIALELVQLGIKAKAYHAGLSNEERNSVQEAFIKDDIEVVCATIAFGMGIDKSNVRFVVHYNLPKSIESYYQEIGRGGRDGLPCETILYYTIGDLMMLRTFAAQSGQPTINVQKLTRMQEFAEAKHCRRRILLNYFGQQQTENCGNCDVCNFPPTHIDGTVWAQKALSALVRIQQLGEQVGSHLLIDVLRGMKHAGIVDRKLNTIKTYGAGADLSAREWNFYLLQMIQLGVIDIAYDKGNVLHVTAFGEDVLKGNYTLYVNEPIIAEYAPRRERNKRDKVVRSLASEQITENSQTLFEQLRVLRKQIAVEEGLPPYVIFHDSTLQDMITKMPKTEAEMLDVSGVSNTKMEKYGKAFLTILSNNMNVSTTRKIAIDELLDNEKLLAYKNELTEKKLRFSTAVVGNVLVGESSIRYYGIGKQVSFYGLLEGVMSYEEVRKRIHPLYAPFETAAKEIRKQHTAENGQTRLEKLDQVKSYFAQPTFNTLTKLELENLIATIQNLPFHKQTDQLSDALKELRQQHFRANEPWLPEELVVLEQLFKGCNNLQLQMNIMGRSEKSILSIATKFI